MRQWLVKAWTWLDHRLGITSTIVPVIVHPVPRNVGWWNVLGSATLVAFIIQIITGVALAMVYVPAPDTAWQTVNFITHEAFLGSVIRGAHYFGAGAMVTLVFAHMVRVFLTGSYKFPREMTWLSGSILLLLTLGMAFTGQLLTWNQDAFWAIVVAAEQAGKVPIIGGLLMQIVVAGWTVGPATLTRFYATHVFLIPALIFVFIAVHLYLVVALGIAEPPVPGDPVDPRTYPDRYRALLERGKPFFPDAFWQDAVAATVVTVVVLALAIVIGPPPVGRVADPTSVLTNPRPDWYFLWYFALLAAIPKISEAVVIVGLPILVGVVLILLPFLSNRGERSPQRRPWAVGSVILLFVAFLALTYLGYQAPWAPIIENYAQIPLSPAVTAGLSPSEQRGAQVFQRSGCHSCHVVAGTGGGVGPDLTDVGRRLSREQLVITILRGRGNMPAFATTLQPAEVDDLVAFLLTLKGEPRR